MKNIQNHDDIEILTPIRKTINGCKELNNKIQEFVYQDFYHDKDTLLFVGDEVSITLKDSSYEGTITHICNSFLILETKEKEHRYKISQNNFKQININSHSTKFFMYNNIVFRINDRIIMTENNYDVGYMNGDMGHIKAILPNGILVEIDDEEFEITGVKLRDVQLSYAITIHKSQGSEYPTCLIVLPKHNMLRRNLLFTAVTRATNSVVIFSEENAYETAISKNDEDKRNSFLKERIQNISCKKICV